MDPFSASWGLMWVTSLPRELSDAILCHLRKRDQGNYRLVNKASKKQMDDYVRETERPFQEGAWRVRDAIIQTEQEAEQYVKKKDSLAKLWGCPACVCCRIVGRLKACAHVHALIVEPILPLPQLLKDNPPHPRNHKPCNCKECTLSVHGTRACFSTSFKKQGFASLSPKKKIHSRTGFPIL